MKNSTISKLASLVAAISVVSFASAVGFVNGGFEGFLGNTNDWNSTPPPGWTITGGTPDTFDEHTNFQNNTFAPSHNGGQFLHGIGWQPTWTESAVQAAVTGLVIGNIYEISFEQTITRNIWSQTGGFWRILFGAESHDSAHMDIPASETDTSPWIWHTMYFTATADTQYLEVRAMSDTDGLRTDLAIDGFYLGDPRPNPPGENLDPDTPTVPDAGASIMLLLLSSLGLVIGKRCCKR